MAAAPETVAHTPLRAAAPIGALTVLVVEPLLEQLLKTVTMLSTAGFKVTAAASFEQAKPLLTQDSPSILLTALRLGMFNGLHLVVRGKALQPGLAALVTSPQPDIVLQREAEQLEATFVLQPIASTELIASILKTKFRREGDEPIRPPFERRVRDRRALVPVDPLAPVSIKRREGDRRRALPWLLPPPPRST
jgi:DNA-binding NtrC family response regulator